MSIELTLKAKFDVPKQPISACAVSDDLCYVSFTSGTVMRCFLSKKPEILATKQEISKIFINPSNGSAIFSSPQGQNFTVKIGDTKLSQNLPKLDKLVLDAVEFIEDEREEENSFIGCSQSGKIFVSDFKGLYFTPLVQLYPGERLLAVTTDTLVTNILERRLFVSSQKNLYVFKALKFRDINCMRLQDALLYEGITESFSSSLVIRDDSLFWLNGDAIIVISLSNDLQIKQESKILVKGGRNLEIGEYSFFILLKDKIVAVSKYNFKTYTSDIHGNYSSAGNLYFYSHEGGIFKLKISGEKETLPGIFVDLEKFEQALKYTETEPLRNKILSQYASWLFEKANFIEAARKFAEISPDTVKFEKVILLFTQPPSSSLEKCQGLLTFLDLMVEKAANETQAASMFLWTINIRAKLLSEQAVTSSDIRTALTRVEFFDQEVIEGVFEIFENFGLIDEIFWFSEKIQNPKKYVDIALEIGSDYEGVLERLKTFENYPKDPAFLEIAYFYGPLFWKFCPTLWVDFLIPFIRLLEIKEILDICAFIDTEEQEIQGFRLFSAIKMECNVKASDTEWLEFYRIFTVLAFKIGHFWDFVQSVKDSVAVFDGQFALRTVLGNPKDEIACYTYLKSTKNLKLAVQIALENLQDLQLALKVIQEEQEEDKKNDLTLIVIKYLLTCGADINSVLSVYRSSTISFSDFVDILPESVTTDDIKQEFTRFLDDVKRKKDQDEETVRESQQALQLMREQLHGTTERTVLIGESQTCEFCGDNLFVSPFFAFLCGHCFHGECLKNFHLSNVAPAVKSALDRLPPEKLNDRVSSECPFCGDSFYVEQIFTPFIDKFKNHEELLAWEVL
jgi:Pep3/Vps18/deep orange family